MQQRLKKLTLSIVAILLILSLIFFSMYYSKKAAISVDETESLYRLAAQTEDVAVRQQKFNQVLSNYLALEKQYQPFFGNGKLYNNIAEVYYHLNDFKMAAFYFYQAKALRPLDLKVQNNLEKTLEKLNIPKDSSNSFWQKPFFFHYKISLPLRLQIVFFLTVFIFLLACLSLWKGKSSPKNLLFFLILIDVIFLSSVIYTKYFEPIEAVIITSAMLHSDHDINSSYVDPNPVDSGHKVAVLNILSDGEWLKIRFLGKVGFIPSKNVKLLQ